MRVPDKINFERITNHKSRTRITGLFILLFLTIGCNFPLLPIDNQKCGNNLFVQNLLGRTSRDRWVDWVERISGSKPVVIGGETVTIDTRFSYAMFSGQANARAFDYVYEQVRNWLPEDQIEIDPYIYSDENGSYTWKNLIVTFPGVIRPDEVIIFSGHLDSTTVREGNPLVSAPGADDNGSGSAALLEAVRLFRSYYFARTIRIIWFTGEEQGSVGSQAYVADHKLDDIVAVINLDMFAFDGDADRCLEVHVGKLPGSNLLGRCFVDTADAQGYDLKFDYLLDQATDRSDHASFWGKDVPAILVLENLIDQNVLGGCGKVDGNPYYHKPGDIVSNLDVDFGFDIAKTALATVAQLAIPVMLNPLP